MQPERRTVGKLMQKSRFDGCCDSFRSLSFHKRLGSSPGRGSDTTTVPRWARIAKLLIPLLLAAGCASAPPSDPCVFLATADIFAVQGAAPVSASATSHASGDVTVSQCFYRLP